MKKLCGYIFCSCGLAFAADAQVLSLEDVIDEVNPSVVSITSEDEETQSLGAGIIVSADGYVVTNAHVAEGGQKITVTTYDDEAYEAELIGMDAKTDIALLKVMHPQDFEPATFADSEDIRVGNTVFAVGNPFGLGNSVSSGIISAKERDIEKGPYDNFIQTDAAINQGNSGGPLFNMDGKIIGMNTAIFSTDGNNSGVSFAVPSNTVRWVVEQIKQNGEVIRGWLGIGVQKIRSNNAEQKNRLIVASMAEDSPAASTGIAVGDILIDVAGLSLKSPRQFSLEISQTPPDTVLPVIVLRDGKEIDLEIKVAQMPSENEEGKEEISTEAEAAESEAEQNAADFPELGIKARFDETKQEFVITEVAKNSEAEIKGIGVGDKFKTADNRLLFGVEDLRVKIKEAQAAGKISLRLIGEDTIDEITLNLEKENEQN
ncbi:MAG: trypsin-like peptidase domain-containing protein [Alphaproteobacteria bacterium]|nr:trypsin-like peptidase domain-containing protein [Alphaproteobacteria bacterium]